MQGFFAYHLMLSCLIVPLTLHTVTTVSAIRPSFRTFEDYLQHLDKNLQTSIVRLGGMADSQSDAAKTEDDASTAKRNVETVDTYDTTGHNVLTNSIGPTADHTVDEEKNNVTCCILGEMAGDKGFHCFAEFYAARIQMRNMNRAHNRKLGFYGRDRLPHYGERLMKTFEQCVAGHGQVFHRCCHLATLERRELDLRGRVVMTGGAGGKRKSNGGREIRGDRKSSSSEGGENDSASASDSVSSQEFGSSSSSIED